MKKLFLLLFMTSTISSIWSQLDYSKGSHVGLSLITVKNVGANLGLYGGTEFGQGEKWKFEVIGNICPIKTKIAEYQAYSDFYSVMVPCEVFFRYASLDLGARYYFRDVYEEGHNFHLDGGVAIQMLIFQSKAKSNEPIAGKYDGGQYNIGAFAGAGYQYCFGSGLILQASLAYEQKIGTIFSIDSYPVNANSAFIIGAGVKYNFAVNFNLHNFRGF
jgi:hypothetical protein